MLTDFKNVDPYVRRSELSFLDDNVVTIANLASGGSIGTAATTVDVASSINVDQTTAGQSLTIPNPTNTAAGKTAFPLFNIGSTSFIVLSTTLQPGSGILVEWTGAAYAVIGTSSGATNVTVAGGKTFTVNNTLTLAGTDGTTMTFPSTSATIARSDAANTFAGVQTFSATPVLSSHITVEGVTSTGATGTGELVFQTSPTLVTPVLGVAAGTSLAVTGLLTTSSPTANFGYATGAGGAVTQATNKSTGVTLSKNTGAITMNNASLAGAATVSFTLTNTTIGANDVVLVSVQSGASTGLYTAAVTATGAGSCQISVTNIGSTASEAVVINFAVIGGVAA